MEMNHEHWNKSTSLKMLIFHWQNIQLFSVWRQKPAGWCMCFTPVFICDFFWLLTWEKNCHENHLKSHWHFVDTSYFSCYCASWPVQRVIEASTNTRWASSWCFKPKVVPRCVRTTTCMECVLEQLILPLCQESFYTLFVINTFSVTLSVCLCVYLGKPF